MAMKFYVLCSKNIQATKRHLDTISREDIYYVFNSQDADYVAEASAWCDAESLPYSVTTSDGTPSTGKTLCLMCFSHQTMTTWFWWTGMTF